MVRAAAQHQEHGMYHIDETAERGARLASIYRTRRAQPGGAPWAREWVARLSDADREALREHLAAHGYGW